MDYIAVPERHILTGILIPEVGSFVSTELVTHLQFRLCIMYSYGCVSQKLSIDRKFV